MNEEVRNELKELIAEFRGKRDMFSRTLSECSARNLSIISAQLAAFVASHEDAILAERPNDGLFPNSYSPDKANVGITIGTLRAAVDLLKKIRGSE